jgi:hypothetical protein
MASNSKPLSDIAHLPTVVLQSHDIDRPLASEKELVAHVDHQNADIPPHRYQNHGLAQGYPQRAKPPAKQHQPNNVGRRTAQAIPAPSHLSLAALAWLNLQTRYKMKPWTYVV